MKIYYRLKENYFDFRMKLQRFNKGYSRLDVWNIYAWMYEIFPKMLRDLEKSVFGFAPKDFDEISTFPKEWLDKTKSLIMKEENSSEYSKEFIEWKIILYLKTKVYEHRNLLALYWRWGYILWGLFPRF